MSHVIAKSKVERYLVRDPGHWWASIMLDDSSGQVTVHSDFGMYGHFWPAPGRGKVTLKGFLVAHDPSYFEDKFSYGRPQYFNEDKTIAALQKDIKEATAVLSDGILDDIAREFEDNIEGMDFRSADQWHAAVYQCGSIVDHVYAGDISAIPCVMEVQPQLRAFMEKVWPKFVEVLEGELAGESSTAPGDKAIEILGGNP